jgi:predicted glutamine amidotransferase
MCELFALSSKIPTLASFSLEEFSRHGGNSGPHHDGWGLAFYEGTYAQVFREAKAASGSEWMKFLQGHQNRSQCVISHIRKATQGPPALRNTQPFSREIGGQRHVFCHNGNLEDIFKRKNSGHFTPIGDTDSEYAFCCLMAEIEGAWSGGKPELQRRTEIVETLFDQLAELGSANFLYSDGDYLYVYANKRRQADGQFAPPGMHYLCRQCENDQDAGPLTGVNITSTASGQPQELVLFASVPLSREAWMPVPSNQLMVARQGSLVNSKHPRTRN